MCQNPQWLATSEITDFLTETLVNSFFTLLSFTDFIIDLGVIFSLSWKARSNVLSVTPISLTRFFIVNTSSIAGLTGVAGGSPYVASKFGVIGITQGVALEYADAGIRINAVCPGHIRTPLLEKLMEKESRKESQVSSGVPMQRLGTPNEVAETVVWLCCSASFMTGQAVCVDGGELIQGFSTGVKGGV